MKRNLLVLLFFASALSALAQESNCGNGIDDDGDGFIDCFDSNCANDLSCKDFYVGRDKSCQVPPSGAAKFEMKFSASSPDRTTWSSARMVVGDLDNDGIPEVVTLHHDDKKLYILNGKDLTIKYTGTITGTAEYFDHTIGNVKKDNCADIFIAEKDGGTFYITSYDCKGVQQWRKPIYGQPITMGLADFDEDGKVELYYRNEILDAETGTRLVKGSGTWTSIDAGPVAVDMLDNGACTGCAGLELVLGGNIYGVDLGTRAADAGTLSLVKSVPAAANYYPKNTSFGWVTSLTSVADYNQDGSLDVLMSGATGSTGGTTTVFFWDVKNSTYKTYQPPNNWKHGTGRLNIADIDGDGKSNTTFVSGNRLFALKEDFTPLWADIPINEGTSGYTGTTVFDFNNDNAVEIVYRDEAYLYIINGKTGGIFAQKTCRSRTANDYPIVVDVDGDGSTEICVICATKDTDDINDISRAPYGQVRAYESNLEAWVPARKVWNQHAYFNVNVNDDLSIPQIQQKHHLVFSTGSCTTGPNRALNTFLNQSPFLDSKGCPTYASSDVTYDAASVKIVPPTCPDQNFTVSLDIRNIGDLGLSGTLPITFYKGNPTQAGATKLNTVNINLSKFNVGDVVSLSNLSVQGTGSTFSLFVVLNDAGTTVPTPIKLPNSTFAECNYTNNIVSASVNPTPFAIQTALISNDIRCGIGTTPSNGAAEAFRMVSGVKTTTGYTFYWFDGATAADTSLAVFKGPVRTGLAAGTYTVIAYHTGIKCGSSSAQVIVGQQTKTLTAAITEDKPFTSCKNPDGKLTVAINGGEPFGNFTYEWFEGNVFGTSPILSKSHVITNVSAVLYSVLVTEKSTGCQVLESAKVTDNTVKPVVTATTTDANCSPAASGSASANVGGNTNKYDFSWYVGNSVKPTADFTGSSYTSLTAGDYTVVATDKTGGCSSAPVTVTVNSKQMLAVATTVVTQQTSCRTPNGSASALVSGTTTGYTFKWFTGNNTLAANQIGTASTIGALAAGVYTVQATNTATGCVDTEIVTIIDAIVTPTLTASVTTQQTNCLPLNGSASASATGGTSFTYYWFKGNIGTPDTTLANFKGAAYTALNAGFYTVVAVNKSTRCSSARGLVEILDNTVAPTITTSSVSQTSCNAATPNGQASANIGGVTAGYKFRWFSGSDTTTFLTQAASITNRAAGTYTVKAVNTTTKCYSTQQVTIAASLVNPAITSTIVNNVNCSGVTPTGSVTIQVNGGTDPITDFTIQWFEGNGTTTPLGTTVGSTSGTNKEKAQALSAGTYTVRVTDNTIPGNGCSTVATFTITSTPAAITVEAADISLTHQSNCNPLNGSATVNEVTVNGTGLGNTTGYTFTWYQSNGTTVIPSSGTAATIGVALAAGNYFVKATNTTTNCVTANTGFTINDTHVNPAVTAASTTNNTNCTGTTPNGAITININGVAPVAGQFTIEWFEGNGTTTTLGTTGGSVAGAQNQTAQNLKAGTYTARVTDLVTPNTGCATTTTFTITDAPATITVVAADINLTHQSDCTPLNGSATVNEVTVNGTGLGNTTGYTFTWYQSNGTTVIPSSGTAATIGVALAAGNYFVKATNTATNCVTANTGFTINDTHVNPVVTSASTVNNTNCTGTTPNGTITININGVAPVAGQFTIEWFEGNGTTTTLGTTTGTVTGAANQTAQNLKAGTYTVRVTDIVTPNTGCATTTTFTITDAPATITIVAADIALTHQSNCNPVNGSATVSEVTVNGTGLGNTTGYTFTWYQSNGTTVIPSSGTAATIGVSLAAGNYFVKATNTATNCVTAIAGFTINDTHVNPVVTAASTINNTNCTGSTPNGAITININGVAPVAGQFTIEWFEGNGTTTTLGTTTGTVTGAANQTAQNLKAGTYTVRVTDIVTPNTGCVTTTTFTITDAPAAITVVAADITLTHQSNCNPVNGSATVNEVTVNGTGLGNTTGYTFTWYQSNGTTVIPSSGTAATIGVSLAAGNYFVKATNTATNCATLITGFTINDTHVNPVVTAASTINNTNCIGVIPNGTITININGVAPVAGQFTIEWFEGNGTTTTLGTTVGSVTGAVNQTAQNLSAGTYTVRVTDLVTPNTGCATTTTFTITDAPATITLVAGDIALTHQSNCSPLNGSATVNEVTVNGTGLGNTTGYTFTWYQSNGTTVVPSSGTAATIGVNLAAGNYFVKATNTATNCVTSITGFTINDTHVNPVVTAASTINNTNCIGVTPNGTITINIDGVAPVAGQFTIEWFEGNGTTTILGTTTGVVAGAANQTAQNLKAGTYTVRVTDLLTPNAGCATTTTFTITDAPATITVVAADIALTHQSNCSPLNGSATVNEVTVNGTGLGNTTGYTFTWYQSNGTTVIPSSGTAATIGVSLAAGNYFVKATNAATNCVTAITGFNINDTHVNPVVTAVSTVNNTNCTGTTPNGTITINIDGIAPVAGQFTIEWFEGNGTTTILGTTTGVVAGAANQTAQNLKAGTYTVRVTDLVTPNMGCATTTTFTITDAPATITVDATDIGLTHQSNCNPVNGSATVNEVTVNGTGGPTGGYSFTWYQSNGTTVIPGSGTGATVLVALATGNYFVKATNILTSCVTAITAFTINDTHVNPAVALLAPVTDNTNCSGTPNGLITIQVNGGANPIGDFTIEWFEGNGITVPLGTTVGTTAGVNDEIAQDLTGGTYTVRVRDNVTPNAGCAVIATFSIVDNLIYPVVSGTPSPNTACDPAKSNGSILADVGGITAGYTFHIFRGQNTLAANEVTTGPAIADDLAAGVYTVQAITAGTGCAATTEVTVDNNIVLPTITTATTPVTSCSAPDGTMSVTSVSIGAIGDYSFSWFDGNSIGAVSPYPLVTGPVLGSRLAGTYTVTGINNTLGCVVQTPATDVIVDDPSTLITINNLPGERLFPAVCNLNTGQLGVEASSPANLAGFAFSWFEGDKNVGMNFIGNGVNFTPPSYGNRISNIESGLHTVIALDNTTGCQDSLSINLPYISEAAIVNLLPSPQTICDLPDGIIRTTVDPHPNTDLAVFPLIIDQSWYEIRVYQNGSLLKTVPGAGSPAAFTEVTDLTAGSYTVIAYEVHPSLNGCASMPNDTTVLDNTVHPLVIPDISADNKNCIGAPGTGSISLNVDGVATPGAGYTYVWHDGQLTTDLVLPVPNVPAPGHTAIGLDGGFYTIEVTNTGDGCSSETTLHINNDPDVISVVVNTTPQSNCAPDNGSAAVNEILIDGSSLGVGNTVGYTFEWFLNDGTTLIPSSSTTATVGTVIGANNYFVQATNTASNCVSPLVQFTVNDISVEPVITLNTLVNNSNCSGAPTTNGSITIDVDGGAPTALNYSIQWYTGIGTTSAIAGQTSATLANLAAGDYTVEVIDIASPGNTCSSVMTFTVIDDLPVFTIPTAAITVTNQTDCVADGTAQITDILIDGVSNGGTGGFTFEWFDNSGASIDGPGATNVVSVALAAGNYSVLATSTTSLCTSIAATFTVNDVSVTPVITLNALVNNSNCTGAPTNGSITIDVDGGVPVVTDYSIQWYTGIGTTSAIAGQTSATLANLAAGDYTVEVIDILSPGNTCSSVMTFTVIDDLPVFTIPAAAITVTNQTDCVADGAAQITDILIDGVSNGGTGGFTFEWFDNSGASIDGPGATNVVGVALAAGNYSVLATSTTSLCTSIASTFTVNDVSVTPVITLNALVDNSNCSGAPTNGSITIDVDGGAPTTLNYSIQWYTGIGTTSAIAGQTSATLANLAAGDYTVEVIDIASPGNTCSSVMTFTVIDDLPVFTIPTASITVTDQRDCVADGAAQITDILIDGGSNGGTAGFTFEWFDNTGASIDGPGATSVVSVALAAGNYSVVATSTTSLCTSIASTFTVNDVSVTPVITLNALVDNSNCSGAPTNGSITIDVDGGAPTALNYSIQWYTGIGTTSAIAGQTSATLANLAAGDYTVEVIDILSPGNTCSSVMTFTVIDDLPVFTIPAAAITVTNQTDCVADGAAQITDILIDGVSNGGTGGFTFEWFDNSGASIDGPGATSVVSVALAAGNYSVVATSTTSLCTSIASTFTVNDVSVTPVITLNALVDNSNCSGAPTNGSITIDVDGGAPTALNYSIQWYTGIGTTSAIAGQTSATLANLAAGDYTVEVIDIASPGNTCSSVMTFTVIDDLPVFTIPTAAITVTNQTDCVADGTAQITDILIDGVSNGGTGGFTFEWFDNSGASIDGPGATNVVSVALAAGNYSVLATSTTSLCTSIAATFTVNDVSVTPVITLNALVNNSNCTGAPTNGSITIDVDGGVPVVTDYSIQWYTGIGTTSAIAGQTSATLANLAAGDYTVEVIDILSPGNTCSSVMTFTVIDDLPVFTIPAAAITVTNQTDCVADGAAQITDILIDGVSNGGTGGFTFEWFDNSGASIDGPGATNVVGVALAAGNYSVLATSTTSLCTSIAATFTVNDVSVTPVITLNALVNNSNCTGAPTNGSITIDVDGGVPVVTDYSIQWYTGIGTTSAIAGQTSATLANLSAGDYTVEVIDILSPGNTCSSVMTFTVIDDLPVFTIPAAAITVTNQTDCVADGAAQITDILIDGVSNGGTGGFTFEWFDNSGASIDGPGATNVVSVALAAGNYSVLATSTTSLCTSIAATFTVNDVSVTPVITLNALVNKTNCTGATTNGSITIDVDGGVPAVTDYSIQWYTGIGTTTPLPGATAATLANLAAGDYTVEVTDVLSPSSSCSSTAVFTIIESQNIISIFNTDLSISDNSDCLPINGTATVTDIIFNGNALGNTTGYTFEWLQSDLTLVDPGNGPTVGINLAANIYIVRATHVASNCISPLTPFEIKDITVIPTLVAVKDQDNIACNASYTGQVSATVSEGFTNGITAGYTFEWFLGSNNTNPADLINSGAVLAGLQEGDYTVRVTDTSTPSGNCVNTATLTVDREIPILHATLTANAQTVCAPIQDGNITVNEVQLFVNGTTTPYNMSVVADRNRFSFQWFDENLVPVSAVVNGNNLSPNLEEGTFYVQISDALGCTSDYVNGIIDDQTQKPVIALDEFLNPAICILPEVRGSLFVSADNHASFADYTFDWFEGNSTAGPVVLPNSPLLNNIPYTSPREYTVRVMNNATQCFSLETYLFTTDTVDIQVVASAVPLTSCVTDNGSLFAATRTGSGQLYNIEWYIGAGVGTTPDFTSNEVLIAPIGTYTAVAKHPTLNFCNSISDTVSVIDGRVYPVVTAMQKAALTYCDPSNPNGVANATVNGAIVGYTFDWYEGSATTPSIYTGSEASTLKATTYIVKATEVISGCPGTTSITITSDPSITPIPQITIISNRTDCTVLDGGLSADVGGVTKDYTFNWYNGSAIKNQPDALGEIYSDIDAGVYTVTATDVITGCISAGVQKELLEAMEYPEFEIKTIASLCDGNNGTAEVNVSGTVDVVEVQWDIQGLIEFGPQISNLPAGEFTVTAISAKNCGTVKPFIVKTDIAIYNAISKNNDGMNDIFEIGCIADFPNNSVRVFNRAGSLVYEATGYDNQGVNFNGISNRGVNILGNDLPDGTYFYIVDKGDGSEPRTGYLELLH